MSEYENQYLHVTTFIENEMNVCVAVWKILWLQSPGICQNYDNKLDVNASNRTVCERLCDACY